jgi:epsilon-lactone hydrolase
MSWQSALLRSVLPRFFKRPLGDKNYDELKAFMTKRMDESAEKRKPPAQAICQKDHVGGVPCEWICVETSKASAGILLYFHGGAYMSGSPATHRELTWRLSEASGMRVLVVDYRVTPEHACPAATDDCFNVYQALLEQGHPANSIALAGDSAGAGLVLATMHLAKQAGLPLPRTGICYSPWTDLTCSNPSYQDNLHKDPMIPARLLQLAAEKYCQQVPATDPQASPAFMDFKGLPPLMIHVGGTEILLDDARHIERAATAAGVNVLLKVWPKEAHAFPILAAFLPEARQAIAESGIWLRALAPGTQTAD